MTFVASPRIRSVGCVYADRCVYAPRICAGTRWWVSLHGWVRIRAPQGAYTQVGAYTQARGAYKRVGAFTRAAGAHTQRVRIHTRVCIRRVGAFTRVAGCVYAAGAYMHARVCTRYAGRCVVNRASRAGGTWAACVPRAGEPSVLTFPDTLTTQAVRGYPYGVST